MLKMKKIISVLLLIVMMIPVYALGEKKLSIVCTSFPCYDFVRAVAGERANIQMLIKPGSEVHTYEPTPADIMAIAGSDLFVCIGGESDVWVEDILDSFGKDAPETLRFFECVEVHENADGDDHDGHEHIYDEHIWTSPVNAQKMIGALSDALCRIDPDGEQFYTQNAGAYDADISLLNTQITDVLANSSRKEMIFADRFPFLYFAEEYGLEWHAAYPSCSAESEPSAKTIAELINKVNADGIKVIYTLELSNGKTAQTIAEETGAQVMVFHSVQNVSETDFSAGETYVSLMQRNIEALKEGLK